jgi:hypothetical protein
MSQLKWVVALVVTPWSLRFLSVLALPLSPAGSSVSDPAYFTMPEAATKQVEKKVEEKESHHMSPVQKMTPSEKAAMLKMSTKRPPLAPQGGEHYVPSGCSMTDPHYSIKDPVYFVDTKK